MTSLGVSKLDDGRIVPLAIEKDLDCKVHYQPTIVGSIKRP